MWVEKIYIFDEQNWANFINDNVQLNNENIFVFIIIIIILL